MSLHSAAHTRRLRLGPRPRRKDGNARILLWAVAAVAAAVLGIRMAAGPPGGAASNASGRIEVPAEVEQVLAAAAGTHLTPEQERTKTEALSGIPAPCCNRHTLSMRCCGCTLSRAAAAYATSLVTRDGDTARVREAIVSWLRSLKPSGYTGTECRAKKCQRSLADGGCAGMPSAGEWR